MRIAWRPAFECPRTLLALPNPEIVFSRGRTEPANPRLAALEREVGLLVSVAAAELAASRLGVPAAPDDSSSLFLADMPALEGRFRTVLLDPSLTEHQERRLRRARTAYQSLLPVRSLRHQIELPLYQLEEHNALVRFELGRAAEAVAWLGKKATLTVREPDTHARRTFLEVEETAQAILRQAGFRLCTVLSPEGFRTAQAALLALDAARLAFTDILKDYTPQ